MNKEEKENLNNLNEQISEDLLNFHEYASNYRNQLRLTQINAYRNTASLIIAVISVGYITENIVNNLFFIISFVIALFIFFLTISYFRESIDSEGNGLTTAWEDLNNSHNRFREKIFESIQKDDRTILEQHVLFKEPKKDEKVPLDYSGEIIVFLLYSSILFLISSYFFACINNLFILTSILIILLVSYELSFKDWSFVLMGKLNQFLDKK
jgi:hypothetical protein